MIKNKIFIFLFLVLVVNQNLFSKEFKSKHGFSITYPNNWYFTNDIENFNSIYDAEEVGGNHFSIYNYDFSKIEYGSEVFEGNHLKLEVNIFKFKEKTFKNWLSKMKDSNEKIFSISDVVIGKRIFYQVNSMIENLEYVVFYFQIKTYIISFVFYPQEEKKHLKVIKEIIKTFEFKK